MTYQVAPFLMTFSDLQDYSRIAELFNAVSSLQLICVTVVLMHIVFVIISCCILYSFEVGHIVNVIIVADVASIIVRGGSRNLPKAVSYTHLTLPTIYSV